MSTTEESPPPVTISLSVDDLATFEKWSRKQLQSSWGGLFGTLTLFGLIALIAAAARTDAIVATAAGAGVLIPIFIAANATGRTRRRAQGRQAAIASGTITADDRGIRFQSQYANAAYLWETYNDVVDTRRHVFLLVSRTNGVVLPKRAFETRKAAGAFVDYAEARVCTATQAASSSF